MHKSRKQFLGKVLILLLLFSLVDTSSGLILDFLYAKSNSGVAYQEYYIINKTNQDLLIFGSSRAAFNYVPDIFSKELDLTTYNAGREGVGIYFHHALLLATLERYTPKTIIIDVDFRDLYARGGDFGTDVFKELAPFYGKINNEFDSTLVRNWYDKILFQSNLFKYNKKVFNIVTGNIIKGRDNFNGYRPLLGELQENSHKEAIENFVIDSNLLITLEHFIQIIQRKNIKLIFVVSPSLKKMPQSTFIPMNKISQKYNIPVLNHLKDQRFIKDIKLFKDEEHLNDNGAKLFSKIISSEMKLLSKSN